MAEQLTSLYFVGSGLEDLAKDLMQAAAALAREAPPVLESIGQLLEIESKQIASEHSRSIPPTIHGGLTSPYTYRLVAGEGVPLAGLYELGNRSNRDPHWFTHPVYGRPPYVEQFRYPFFRPALRRNRASITILMETMWERALGPYRLPVEGSTLGFGNAGLPDTSTTINLP